MDGEVTCTAQSKIRRDGTDVTRAEYMNLYRYLGNKRENGNEQERMRNRSLADEAVTLCKSGQGEERNKEKGWDKEESKCREQQDWCQVKCLEE